MQFYLATGQFVDIYVCFQPTKGGPAENKIILACDNQTSKFYTIKGNGAILDLNVIQIDDKKLNFQENPLDAIWFEESHPKSECSRTLFISNVSPLPVNFHWSTYVNSDEVISLEAQKNHYTISPFQGVMQPNSTFQFKITFCPTSAHPFNEFADLFVEQVPISALAFISKQLQESSLFKDPSALFLGSNGKFPPIPYFKFNLHGEGSICHLQFDPPFYIFPTNVSINCSNSGKVVLKNTNNGTVSYNLKLDSEKSSKFIDYEINPMQGLIPANGQSEISFKVTLKSLGTHSAIFLCSVEHGLPLHFLVQASSVGPSIKISAPECNFGIVRCGQLAKTSFTIHNLFDLDINVLIKSKDLCIKITPSSLTIPSKSSFEVTAEVFSDTVRKIEEILKIKVESGITEYLTLRADIQKPLVYLDFYEFNMGSLSAGVSSKEKKCTLFNYGNLSAVFSWDTNKEDCKFSINPSIGEILPHSSQICTFTVTPFIGGLMEEL